LVLAAAEGGLEGAEKLVTTSSTGPVMTERDTDTTVHLRPIPLDAGDVIGLTWI
jgi:hypothetical protein